MMNHKTFQLHPFSDSQPTRILGSVSWDDEWLQLNFYLYHPPESLDWPKPAERPEFRNQLWQKTCFECFEKHVHTPNYWEWNLAPSGDWACFEFTDYRQKHQDVNHRQPLVKGERHEHGGHVQVQVPRHIKQAARLGVAAILSCQGRCQYWSLIHPGPQPDFHDPKGMIIELD